MSAGTVEAASGERPEGRTEGAVRRPSAPLRPYLGAYQGYRLRGYPAGEHLGMPAPSLTVILALDPPLDIARAARPDQKPDTYASVASGITTTSVVIRHDGNQHGIQLELTPLGARALLGVPAAALGQWLVGLDDVIGADAEELTGRLLSEPSWDGRFDILDEVLTRRVREVAADRAMMQAWRRLLADGTARVGDVADELGWSRRHLTGRFSAEYGITPKDAVRLGRFHRSLRVLRRPGPPPLSEVAHACGYYDQAHMTRDWTDLGGTTPTRWLRDEVFPFVQDDEGLSGGE
ncbi:helix-turn-helix domain-containing protein [Rhodococcus triatomae]|uniref:helix-turn-helix domain-containing protein n=1 Tax=Rhodococcus triatomae TaxID=300028 RepID=UPI000933A15F|nr:helix-turn-helix domain-containing protein [Rhodococcus triatomae]